MSWINHLPPACWSTFWKSNFRQQLGCRFDIMDNESYFFLCVLTYAIIYVLIHQIIFRFYLLKVAEDDIAFKLAILKKSLHLNENTCFCSITQSSKLVLGSLLAKNNLFVQFWTKNFASSRMSNCGSGLPAEWHFRSQNEIEASDSPLPGGLWVKRLITHASSLFRYSLV